MFNKFTDWLDDRTGYKALLHEALDEPHSRRARWRYVFGSALSTTFMIQLTTGLLLMLSYSPSSATAWGSVFYINNKMFAGWFIRGIHHFGSQAMVVLLAMHLLQVLWAGAYRKPREVNWWFGMALMFLTLGFSLTGYLLPGTRRATGPPRWPPISRRRLRCSAPTIQKIVVGGTEYGNQTITRFFGLHVGVLPTLFFLCLVAHVALFRRHGLTPPRNAEKLGRGTFWPEQLFMDSVASLAVFGVLLYLVLSEGGANLDAPADPSSAELPCATRVVLPLALSDAEVLPWESGDDRHDHHSDGDHGGPAPAPPLRPAPPAQAGPLPGVQLRLRPGRQARAS